MVTVIWTSQNIFTFKREVCFSQVFKGIRRLIRYILGKNLFLNTYKIVHFLMTILFIRNVNWSMVSLDCGYGLTAMYNTPLSP